ncbi:hypothetical protein QZN18_20560 [Klebsiella variicola]|uniref:hypothetical protein n=1 Tax=Klebsiella variicola TaxID=244366 RepID=UPI002660514A|nr:hypothetical protein [Klebsiella variicola]WKL60380.1 hypothetical protein QZN18_20560 [Klebsiella variicola]
MVSEKITRRVVCAANQYESKIGSKPMVFIGVRHYCPIMRHSISQLLSVIDRATEVQGFVDQFGVFMDRKEALKVAKEAGQLNVARIKTWPDDELFSEDLY